MQSLEGGAERRAIFATERGAIPRNPTSGALLKNASPSIQKLPTLTAPKKPRLVLGGQFRTVGR